LSRIFIISLVLLLSSCQPDSARDSFILMNTIIEVNLDGINEVEWYKIEQDFIKQTEEFDWHAKGGKGAEWDTLSRIAYTFRVQTQGCFDTRIRPLVKLWADAKKSETLPSDDAIKEALKQHEEDFGGIAKGYLADKLFDRLIKDGAVRGYINIGGHIRVIGNNLKTGKNWEIGIRHPDDKDKVFTNVSIDQSRGVATSGDYERFFVYKGKKYCHILDPNTGYPPTHNVRSVTVIAPNLTIADALATGLFVAGTEGAKEWFNKLPYKLDVYWILQGKDKLELLHWNKD